MAKKKKVGISISVVKHKHSSKIIDFLEKQASLVYNARVTYNRKTTNFYVTDINVLDRNPLNEERVSLISSRISRAVYYFSDNDDDFEIKGFKEKYQFCYDEIISLYNAAYNGSVNDELGNILTYNQYNRFQDSRYNRSLVLPMLNNVLSKSTSFLLGDLSIKSQKLFLAGYILNEFIRIKDCHYVLDWVEHNYLKDFKEYFKDNNKDVVSKFGLSNKAVSVNPVTEVINSLLK